MYTVEVTIKGTSPLLMNRHPLPEEDVVITERPGSPPEHKWEPEFERTKYKMEDGKLYQPAVCIHKCMEKAALNFQIPGKGKKTYRDMIAAEAFVEPDMIIHKIQHCVADRRWVRIKTAAIVRTRAKLPEWELDFRIVVVQDQLPEEALNKILQYGSQAVGIGDYRPQKGGPFGRFMIVKFEKVEESA